MIQRIYDVCKTVEETQMNDNNAYILEELISKNVDIVCAFSNFKFENKQIKSIMINTFIVQDIVEDPNFIEIDSYDKLKDYLYDRGDIYNEYLQCSVDFRAIFNICNMFKYEKSVKIICGDIAESIKMFCLYGCIDMLDDRVVIISNMNKITDILSPEGGKGTIQSIYDGYEKLKQGKLADIISPNELENITGAAQQLMNQYGHEELGKEIVQAVMENINEPGVSAMGGIYKRLQKKPKLVEQAANDILDIIGVSDDKVGDVLNNIASAVGKSQEKDD